MYICIRSLSLSIHINMYIYIYSVHHITEETIENNKKPATKYGDAGTDESSARTLNMKRWARAKRARPNGPSRRCRSMTVCLLVPHLKCLLPSSLV